MVCFVHLRNERYIGVFEIMFFVYFEGSSAAKKDYTVTEYDLGRVQRIKFGLTD